MYVGTTSTTDTTNIIMKDGMYCPDSKSMLKLFLECNMWDKWFPVGRGFGTVIEAIEKDAVHECN